MSGIIPSSRHFSAKIHYPFQRRRKDLKGKGNACLIGGDTLLTQITLHRGISSIIHSDNLQQSFLKGCGRKQGMTSPFCQCRMKGHKAIVVEPRPRFIGKDEWIDRGPLFPLSSPAVPQSAIERHTLLFTCCYIFLAKDVQKPQKPLNTIREGFYP
jgi:hypothetical protein